MASKRAPPVATGRYGYDSRRPAPGLGRLLSGGAGPVSRGMSRRLGSAVRVRDRLEAAIYAESKAPVPRQWADESRCLWLAVRNLRKKSKKFLLSVNRQLGISDMFYIEGGGYGAD